MSQVTVKQAADLTGKSRETINTATNDGTLSYSHNSRNHKVIDIAELERVYPLVKTVDEIKQSRERVRGSQKAVKPDSQAELAVLQEKLAANEKLQEILTAERLRERQQLESEIETLRKSLEKSQEQHSKALLLITDQSGKSTQESSLEKAVRVLESKIANQQSEFEKRVGELKQEAVKDAMDLTWWQLLFK